MRFCYPYQVHTVSRVLFVNSNEQNANFVIWYEKPNVFFLYTPTVTVQGFHQVPSLRGSSDTFKGKIFHFLVSVEISPWACSRLVYGVTMMSGDHWQHTESLCYHQKLTWCPNQPELGLEGGGWKNPSLTDDNPLLMNPSLTRRNPLLL